MSSSTSSMHSPPTLALPTVRTDFAYLNNTIHGKPIIYLDSAATTQKPRQVIDRIMAYYGHGCASINRSVHALSEEATRLYNDARRKVARFIHADEDEIIFVRNATEGINLLSQCLKMRGSVLTTVAEHHSNLLPWMQTRDVEMLDVSDDGSLQLTELTKKLRSGPALVSIGHVSNVLGLVNPIEAVIEEAKRHKVLSLIDAAQSMPHMPINVKELDCDFLVFSGHKMLAPSGIGVLYVKSEHLQTLSPYQLGGGNVRTVHRDQYTLADPPERFEPGTPNIEGAIALGAAMEYLDSIGRDTVLCHSRHLTAHAISLMSQIDNLRIVGSADMANRISTIAFELKGMDAHSVAKVLNARANVMIRSGFHCAQPLHEHLKIDPTARVSFYVYNTWEEIEVMVDVLSSLASFI